MHAAVARECRMTRASLGIFDASTLGKIEVVGPDAVAFMERMYTNPWAKLGVGRCRYGLLLGEDGFIRDDGSHRPPRRRPLRHHHHRRRARPQHDGGLPADRVARPPGLAHLDHRAVGDRRPQRPERQAAARAAGRGPRPLRRRLPAHVGRECTVAGFPARLFRVSFTGELGFEVNVPARHGLALWEKLIEAGQQADICPYGTETMHVLRAEKGYIIVGQDTDGMLTRTTPA